MFPLFFAFFFALAIVLRAQVGLCGFTRVQLQTLANALTKDGLIDQEQGLGYVLYDRFAGVLPEPLEARGVGKRAADELPEKKPKFLLPSTTANGASQPTSLKVGKADASPTHEFYHKQFLTQQRKMADSRNKLFGKGSA